MPQRIFNYDEFDAEATRAHVKALYRLESMLEQWSEQRLLDYAVGDALGVAVTHCNFYGPGSLHCELRITSEHMTRETIADLLDAVLIRGGAQYRFTSWYMDHEVERDYGGDSTVVFLQARFDRIHRF